MKPARLFFAAVLLFVATVSFGQQSFMDEPGIPAFTTAFPVEHGFINLANGNLHIEIPIATYPQRGNIKALHARLVYDSRFWTIRTDPVTLAPSWIPGGIPNIGVGVGGGFRLITDGEPGTADSDRGVAVQCACVSFNGGCQPRFRTTYSNYFYQEPNGSFHRLANTFKLINKDGACSGPASTPDGTAYAIDGSGYKIVVTGYTHMTVYAPDGSQVFPTLQDPNGNFYSTDGQNNVVDTLGRTPVVATGSGSQVFLDYLCTQGCNSANGDRSRITINTTSPQWSTQFNQTNLGNVNEYSGPGTGIQSIVLADGSSYQFQADSYGQITSMTLPTGGQITYGYSNFTEPSGNVNRWVTSMVKDGQSWSFTPVSQACSVPPCTIQVTVTTPPYGDGTTTASDNRVYFFTVTGGYGGGAWNTQTQYFRGAVGGTPVLTKTTDYGVRGSCPATAVIGMGAVPIRETLTWPAGSGTLSKKAEYCYDNYANVTATKEWDYQINGSFAAAPDREIDNVYHTDPTTDATYIHANLIRLLKTSTTLNGAGTQVAQSTFGYDETGFQASGITTHHVTPAASLGNQTSATKWLNTTGGSVASTTKWFDTGEVYQSIDPLLHTTTLSYDSAFSGAYLTQACNALSPTQCSYNGYDFNTGLRTSSTDVNGTGPGDAAHSTTYTYDTLLRPLCTNLPDGGQTCLSYPDANHVSRTQIITSALSDLSTTIFDGLGRTIQSQHTLPDGISKVDTTYDPIGSPSTVSNPYFTTTDPTYGITQNFHDALGRGVKTIKQDGSVSSTAYSVRSSGTQNGACVTGTDEAGNQRMTCHNGFGELVEVDEPGGPDPGTQATASLTISGAINSTWLSPGSPHLAAVGTALASVTMSDGSSHDFYFDTNQHLCQMSWFSGSGWYDQDLTSMTEAGLPLAGSSVAAAVLSGVIHVFYQGANLHIYDMNWTGSVWQNVDMTALTGASAMSGTKMSTVLTGNPNSPMMFYEGTNQHLFTVYWNSSANAWQNADLNALSGATTLMAVKGSVASVMFSSNTVIYVFYVGANQHLIAILWNGSAWITGDATNLSGAGGSLPVAGSALTSISTVGGTPLMNFYEGPSQHIYGIYWSNAANAWQSLDFTSFTGATNVAAALAALSSNPAGPQAFYLGNNLHLEDINWNGSAWVNSDLTSLSGSTVVAAAGSSLSSHGTAGPNTYNLFFEGTNQHIYHTYYNPSAPGWFNEDPLVTASNFVVDSGTVSLTVPNFTATVCYGVSVNPICAGQPVNASPGDIANALAAVLNGAGSPVNASVTGSSLNLTWRTVGVVTATVASMTSISDNQSLFPNGSFTSTSATFSGGIAASNQSIRNPFVTQYQYDSLGNLLRVDQKGSAPSDATQWRTRTFTYDSLSRLLTANNPESGMITYSYDADSELLQKTSPAPNQTGSATQTVSYCYDELHRLTGKGYGAQSCPLASPVVTYVYDSGANAKGHLTSLADQAGSGIYGYDNMGRVTTETRVLTGANNAAISKSASYEYNLDGSLYKLHYPSGAIVTYASGAADLSPSAVDSANGINYVTAATYGADSSLTGFVNGNSATFTGIANAFSYNKRLQPVAMSANAPSQTVFSIGYDFHVGNGTTGADNGNVFGITNYKDQTRNQTFAYDLLNRLTSAQNSGTDCSVLVLQNKTKFWGNSYVYDAWGNLLQKNITKCGAEHLLATADAQNRIHVSAPDYLYDAAGNMTTDVTDGVTSVYDQENRISTATSNGITTTYTYDADGHRVRKSAGNLAANGTLYWYMAPGVVAETDLAGTTPSEYIFFDGERVARRDGATGTGGVFYYFSDRLKTASVITDSAGLIKAESDYYPWGGELQFTNADSNHYKFTGKERDGESGLDYFGARYYSNGLGRWVSADWSATPISVPYADFSDPQSMNLNSYVRGNPLSHADIDGHFWQQLKNYLNSPVACWCTDAQVEQKELDFLNKHFPGGTYQPGDKKIPFNQLDSWQLQDAYKAGLNAWWAENSKRIDVLNPNQALVLVPGITRMIYLSKVQDPKLRNVIDMYYREKASHGDGGVADAIEYERATGQQVGGKDHTQKGIEVSNALRNLINGGNLNGSDTALAQRLLDRLTQALTYTK